ncbi:MAG: hypothetical protein ACLFN8_03505 [Candidatus Woesearchaeota archaeon]
MEQDIEKITSKMVKNFKRFQNILNLKKLNVEFVDYLDELVQIDVLPRPVTEFRTNNSGFFYNDNSPLINIFDELVPYAEFYAEDGLIKLIRDFNVISREKTRVKDTYCFFDMETCIEYDIDSFYIDDSILYPKLFAKDFPLYGEFNLNETIDLDNSSKLELNAKLLDLNNLSDDDDDDYDDDDYDDDDDLFDEEYAKRPFFTSEQTFDIKQVKSYQNLCYVLDEFTKVKLYHDDSSNMGLTITNNVGPILSLNYKVSATPRISFNTKMSLPDIKILDGFLSDENNSTGDLIDFLGDLFKDAPAMLNSLNKGVKQTYFQDGLKHLNIVPKVYKIRNK